MRFHEAYQNAIKRGPDRGRLDQKSVAVFTRLHHSSNRGNMPLDSRKSSVNFFSVGRLEVTRGRLGMTKRKRFGLGFHVGRLTYPPRGDIPRSWDQLRG